jgi:hypothetical protein
MGCMLFETHALFGCFNSTLVASLYNCDMHGTFSYIDDDNASTMGLNPARGTDVSCECCVLPGRGLCAGLIALYRVWCV